ncbi:hypothetical protein MKW92_047480 [Papaver armeniacum]|nr:hypothetical protein MKW92_047480 [Papaver armeniacum]
MACPTGAYKNALCQQCPPFQLPHCALYITVRALVLGVARLKFFNADEPPGPAPTQHGSQIDGLLANLEISSATLFASAELTGT